MQAAARSPWFHSARFDLVLILATPLLTWPLVKAAQGAWGATLLTQLIFLTATGHYFATFVRAYGDRELFARFKVRFVLAPIVLLAVCVTLFATGRAASLLLVTAGWAFWHWLAQAFGFARIYDIKVGSFRPWTARLDKALVIVGFVSAVTLNPGSIVTFGRQFQAAGIALPDAATFAIVQGVVIGAVVAVVLAYAINLATTIARGEPWSWQKQFMHVTTIGYYWFAFAYVPNVLIAYVLYELFHDIQYYAITWLTCRQRVKRPGVTSWMSAMFRPHWIAAAVFVAAMSAFGAIDVLGRTNLAPQSTEHQVWLGVVLAIALLHYYFDGFIWKARERTLGADLGIGDGLRAAMVPALRHGAAWSLFFVPIGALLTMAPTPPGRSEALRQLVAIAPGDFAAREEFAFDLGASGDLQGSLEHYRASIAANPDYAPAHAHLGATLEALGDVDGAIRHYEAALRCENSGDAHRQANLNLGVLMLLRGDRAAAAPHLQAAARLGRETPQARMLALANALPADEVDRRLSLYGGALQLVPNDPTANFGMGTLLSNRGQFERAATHFSAVLRTAPTDVPALLGLAAAHAELGRRGLALESVQRALQLEPTNPQAQALRVRLGGD